MIINLGEIYKDELLYSALARIHKNSVNISAKHSMIDYFGSSSASASILLPSRIDALVENMPPGSTYTSDELIENHTLFKYYSAFFSEERAEKLKEKMKGDNGSGIVSGSGIMASSISQEIYFKVCPKCSEEMNSNGIYYWNRLFQLPEVKVCPTHDVKLHYTSILKRGRNKHEFNCASADTINSTKEITFKSKFIGDLEHIAKEVDWILTHDYKRRDLEWIKKQYLNILIKKGFAYVSGRIMMTSLIKDFISFYSHEFLELMQVDFDEDLTSNWVMDLLRCNSRQTSPLKNLLMLRYLGYSFQNFMNETDELRPFGEGPWMCRNPICKEYMKPVITDVKLEYSTDTKQIRGLFKHDKCGHSYYRYEETNSIRVKEYGSLWEDELKSMVKQNMSLRSIAKKLNVDPKTIVSHAERLGINHSWNLKTYVRKDHITTLDRDKNEWLKLIGDNPNVGVTALRSINTSLYLRIYRNDRKWLQCNTPKSNLTPKPSTRIDWHSRDIEKVNQVKDAIDEILNSDDYPIRISISRVGKMINSLTLLEKHLDKIPITKQLLDRHVESDNDFRRRRIEWAVRSLEGDNVDIVAWRVFRLASIRDEYQEDLMEYVSDLIDI